MVKTDKKLPVGVDSFEKLIRDGYYYLDKTGFIRQLVGWHGEVKSRCKTQIILGQHQFQ